ncbi:MAG: Thymidylate kinase [Candidatus Tokpelaia hoelldobleri]|uniref:Thymidylate kinase n=1 Tax=Candidatus Tokpelaia hoelldobleri TaxID=1902579 RepID=A0A1U9JUR5_9HYPH|nr:MAG: Thymidylate kinase [Candidatus Tokpelaia hoelldoblerii]
MQKAGFFITFEGGEGAGKSTQIKHLAAYLRTRGFPVVITREPGGTPGAEAIRHVLLSGHVQEEGALMEAVLFAAARADHVETLIAPALARGEIVLCDRFIDSTRVYQGAVGEIPQSYIRLLEYVTVDKWMPDLTFILDIPARLGMERANARRAATEAVDRFEQDSINIQEERRQAFLKIARKEPERCCIIDATQPMEAIAAEIAQISDEKIKGEADSGI